MHSSAFSCGLPTHLSSSGVSEASGYLLINIPCPALSLISTHFFLGPLRPSLPLHYLEARGSWFPSHWFSLLQDPPRLHPSFLFTGGMMTCLGPRLRADSHSPARQYSLLCSAPLSLLSSWNSERLLVCFASQFYPQNLALEPTHHCAQKQCVSIRN